MPYQPGSDVGKLLTGYLVSFPAQAQTISLVRFLFFITFYNLSITTWLSDKPQTNNHRNVCVPIKQLVECTA